MPLWATVRRQRLSTGPSTAARIEAVAGAGCRGRSGAGDANSLLAVSTDDLAARTLELNAAQGVPARIACGRAAGLLHRRPGTRPAHRSRRRAPVGQSWALSTAANVAAPTGSRSAPPTAPETSRRVPLPASRHPVRRLRTRRRRPGAKSLVRNWSSELPPCEPRSLRRGARRGVTRSLLAVMRTGG